MRTLHGPTDHTSLFSLSIRLYLLTRKASERNGGKGRKTRKRRERRRRKRSKEEWGKRRSGASNGQPYPFSDLMQSSGSKGDDVR